MRLSFLILSCFISLSSQQLTAQSKRSRFTASDFVFDLFKSTPNAVGEGGTGRRVNVQDLPVLDGLGVSSVIFHQLPCSINLPHVHPRGTELFHVLEGEFLTGFLEENTGRYIETNLTVGQVTVFPQGLIHFEQNLGCKNATFLSAFSSEDPGVLTITTRLFNINQQALTSSFNQNDKKINSIRSDLVENPAMGLGECLRRCNIRGGKGGKNREKW